MPESAGPAVSESSFTVPVSLSPRVIQAMRQSADPLLTADATLPRHDDLEEAVLQLRGHLGLLIPAVDDLARTLPDGNVTRSEALATVGNARIRLNANPGPGLVSATKHAKSLARELCALCDGYETLTAASARPA